jgi:hypothetical protein
MYCVVPAQQQQQQQRQVAAYVDVEVTQDSGQARPGALSANAPNNLI